MNNQSELDRERRLQRAREIFREFKSMCFWSWKDDPEITEATIPHLIKELRHYGGARGYRAAAELLCR
jgi:hypothetical protein